MASRVLFFVCAASLLGCGGSEAGESVDENAASVTSEAAPLNANLQFEAAPASGGSGGVWLATGQTYVTLTAHVIDASTYADVSSGGYVQFYTCDGVPEQTTCNGRYARFGDPMALNSNGEASILHLTTWNQNMFVYYKYLPRGSGYKRAKSDTYRIVTGSPP